MKKLIVFFFSSAKPNSHNAQKLITISPNFHLKPSRRKIYRHKTDEIENMLSKISSRYKVVLGICFVLVSSASYAGQVLQAGTTKVWSIQDAREEVFRGAKGTIDTWGFPSRDPDRAANLKAIAEKRSVSSGRKITVFDTKDYAVSAECSLESRYYDSSGELYLVQYNSSPSYSTEYCDQDFPIKSLRYDFPSGKLIQASFSPKRLDDYVYEADGSFLGHWLGSKCYNADGSICGYRRSFIEKTVSQPK